MQAIAQFEIQQAVYDTIAHDPPLQQITPGGIHDGSLAPQAKRLWPYIIIDSWTENPDDRLSTIGRTLTFVVHIYSMQYGTREAAAVCDRVCKLLNRTKMPAGQWNITDISFLQLLTVVQTDEIRHHTLRFRVTCQPLP